MCRVILFGIAIPLVTFKYVQMVMRVGVAGAAAMKLRYGNLLQREGDTRGLPMRMLLFMWQIMQRRVGISLLKIIILPQRRLCSGQETSYHKAIGDRTCSLQLIQDQPII